MKQGFSLIELLITITIMGILFAMTVPSFNNMIKTTQFETEAEEVLSLIMDARNDVLSGKTCSGDIEVSFPKKWYNPTVSFGCNTDIDGLSSLVLSDTQILIQDPKKNDLSDSVKEFRMYYENEPFQMKMESEGGTYSYKKAYLWIESLNLIEESQPVIWTICLNTIKGFPEMYRSKCDCNDLISFQSIPDCNL